MITVNILEDAPLEVQVVGEIVTKEIIPEGYYRIEGTTEITENGKHNVGDYEFAIVNVPTSALKISQVENMLILR